MAAGLEGASSASVVIESFRERRLSPENAVGASGAPAVSVRVSGHIVEAGVSLDGSTGLAPGARRGSGSIALSSLSCSPGLEEERVLR